jgi:hypothetical protein
MRHRRAPAVLIHVAARHYSAAGFDNQRGILYTRHHQVDHTARSPFRHARIHARARNTHTHTRRHTCAQCTSGLDMLCLRVPRGINQHAHTLNAMT